MSWYDSQITLDAFLNPSPSSPPPEPQGSKSPEPQESEAELAEARPEPEVRRCGLCGEPSVLLSFYRRLRLHLGAMEIYVKDGKLIAKADIKRVYHKCRKGLIDNLRFLMHLHDRMKAEGKAKGGRFVLLGVGKAADDDLYVYGIGRFPEEFGGFRVKHIEIERPEDLERLIYYMDPVPEDVIEEALREPETEEDQIRLSEFVE